MGNGQIWLYKQVGEQIKKQREQKVPGKTKLTQAMLAKRVGVQRTTITQIEAGTQRVSMHLLYDICVALDVEIDSLLPRASEVKQVRNDEAKLVEKANLEQQGVPNDFMKAADLSE